MNNPLYSGFALRMAVERYRSAAADADAPEPGQGTVS